MSNAKAIVKAFTATVGLILVVGIITASAQTSQFVSMMRNARVFFADGTAAAPSITFGTDSDTGFFAAAAGFTGYTADGVSRFLIGTEGIRIGSGRQIGWSSSADPAGGGADTILCRGAANVIGIGGCTSSFPAIKRSTNNIQVRLADDSAFSALTASNLAFTSGVLAVNLLMTTTAPTISAGFGTSPSIPNSNGTAAFTVNVGTGGTASSGTIGLPTAANGWVCNAFDFTSPTTGGGYYVKQTGGTTTTAVLTGFNTAGAATAWTASDVLRVSCFAY
jgi:hypothetical protein